VKIAKVHTVSQSPDGESDMYEKILETPLSVCVDAESWQSYVGGVVTLKTCKSEPLDHCVQAVAINAEKGYWVVKNQWGTSWGEEGHIRVATGNNVCGIASLTTYVEAEATGNVGVSEDDEEVYL